MPIRSIKDSKYKGISELYRKSDGSITGYYVTYRDAMSKPVKRRVDANTRDEALAKLIEIKQEVENEKNCSNITTKETTPPTLQKIDKVSKVLTPDHIGKTIKEYQEIISSDKSTSFIAIMDIVAFDDINILYGYDAAINVLNEVQEIIRDTLDTLLLNEKPNYDIHHLYEDKLCLVINGTLDNRVFDIAAKEIVERVSKHHFNLTVETSIHINVTMGATNSSNEFSFVYAEKALREAKSLNLGYLFYDNFSQKRDNQQNQKIYEVLLNTIHDESVIPVFQGIFDVQNVDAPCKFESLMRLQDSNGRMLSPSVFLGKSKECRLYTQLMLQMIDKVFQILEENKEASLTINLSYLDFNNAEICSKLIHEIKRLNVRERLTVEILESEQIKDIEVVNEFVFKLKKLGVLIAIDDFGSGFSNFDNILNFDVDFIKIDGSLISNIHNEKHRVILQSIIGICKELNIKTIAEYISDAKIMQVAKNIGVDYFQGYFFHKPEMWENAVNAFNLQEVKHA